ncbi:MAG TPA: DUF3343 domain-containing protein [Longimicrobiales bacterium]
MNAVFLFDTTHHALWAEEIARERGLAAEVVPAPAGANARCGLALEVLPDDVAPLETALRDAGVVYRLH